MRKIAFIIAISFISWGAFAQAGEPQADNIGVDTAQQNLQEISVHKFEDAAFWYATMDLEAGRVSLRRFEGGAIDKEPLASEQSVGIQEEDKYVLGAKTVFVRRSKFSYELRPLRPIPVPGITKTISLWVVGRNINHVLYVEFEDHFGNKASLPLGKLNFSGWKKLTVAVPPNIKQRDYHYNNQMGIKITGFRVDCDIDDAYGTYYLYLDDLRVVTDLFAEQNRDEDDMVDAW
ncbi:flagellar filament outer layer protein FlaA [Spirochaeta cellobiosiphila]|uniref:flagellar filament outer layer protein FlaA n=1 Tax=Spirochaeta cellobiosiphila TaxID=504483 RepID=UPI00040FF65B|nr:flagellar filament outer layer protein FlaA [Spirochaeta cellobiosiphila]